MDSFVSEDCSDQVDPLNEFCSLYPLEHWSKMVVEYDDMERETLNISAKFRKLFEYEPYHAAQHTNIQTQICFEVSNMVTIYRGVRVALLLGCGQCGWGSCVEILEVQTTQL